MGTKYEIYVGKPMFEAISEAAEKKNTTKSAFLNEVLVSIGLGKNEFKPVVLQVPKDILNDDVKGRERLSEWLYLKSSGLVNHYFPE